MFKKKEEKKHLIHFYYFYRKIQRGLLAIAIIINIIFVSFVLNEGNSIVLLIFALNLYVAGWAYWQFMSERKKREKEKNPDVK